MFGVLQDWIELDGSTAESIAQSGARWANLEGYQSVTFWLEVRFVEDGDLVLHYETAPTIDPTIFTTMTSVALSAGSAPVVTVINPASPGVVPLAGLVRWRVQSLLTRPWRLTFRVRYSAKRRGIG